MALPDPFTVTDFQVLAESLPEIVWVAEPGRGISYTNAQWTNYTGLNAEESLGLGWTLAVHPDDVHEASRLWQKGINDGKPFDVEFRLRDRQGSYRWYLARAVPQAHDGRPIERWIGNLFDIDRHHRATDSLSLLADTGSVLGSSLDLQGMLNLLLAVLVPRLCDWAVISLANAGSLRPAAILHRDPSLNELARTLIGRPFFVSDVRRSPTFAAYTQDEPQIWNATSSVALTDATRPDTHDIIKRLGQRSALIVPLRAQGTVIGTLSAVRSFNSEPFHKSDIPLLTELGSRAAQAITRARLFEREHLIAETLQLASVPPRLPDVPGFQLDSFYAPARDESRIGGDWYDVFPAGDGRLAFSVGDVSGSGLNAAVQMGRVRQTIRALTAQETEPSELMRALGAAYQREDASTFTTAIVGFIDFAARRLTYSVAGHPPPFLRSPDGTVHELPADGLPLPLLSHEHPPTTVAIELPPGSTIVFYTDGLVEETRNIERGFGQLRDALCGDGFGTTAHPAQMLHRRLLPNGANDDVAILTMRSIAAEDDAAERTVVSPQRLTPPPWAVRWRFEVLDFGAPANARDAFIRFLRDRGAPDADYASAEIVFGELIGNVVRHAQAPLFLELDWNGEYPVLHVQDRGPGFDWKQPTLPGPDVETGRGLFLAASLSRELDITRIPNYGTHIRVVLDIPRSQEER